MSRTVLVRVNKDHIEKGKRADCEACPIALAISEADDYRRVWEVGHDGAVVYGETGPVARMELPEMAVSWMRAFDEGHPVRPFTFYGTIR